MQDHYLSSFTPSLMKPEDLEAIFVQREKLLEDLIAGVRESATTKNKHYRLLMGMRGIGKTHTIALLFHRLREEEDLEGKLLIAWLKEEEWGVSSWLDLLLRIFKALEDIYPEEHKAKLAIDVEALYELSPKEATTRGEVILRDFLGKRTLLILTENFDEILKGLGDTGQKKLRAYLQNKSFITIVATSQSLSADFTSKKRAFYGWFNNDNLNKLALDEAIHLLTKIAELQEDSKLAKFIRSATGQDRIKAIHHLAGGNHRVYIIFSQFLTCESLNDLVQPVMQTLDELTPYYQARMQWLSPQQRKIIELLCDRRRAVPVKEIAQRCFISHQTASSQLKDLLTKGYVAKQSQGRESFYELQEPLMRICLEVKKQRGEPIKLFIDFLRIWYTNQELKERLQQLPDDCLEIIYITKALEIEPVFYESTELDHSNDLNDLSQKIIASFEQRDYEVSLSLCERMIKIASNKLDAWNNKGLALSLLGREEEAIESYDRAIKLNPDEFSICFNRGNSLNNLGKYQEAIESYDRAIKLNPDESSIWLSRGNSLDNLGKYQEAIESYDQAIKLNPDSNQGWYNRGNVLVRLGRNEEAVGSFDQSIKINPDDYQSWCNRGNVLVRLGRNEEAVGSFDQSIRINSSSYQSWCNRGSLLSILGKNEEAVGSFDQSIRINPNFYQSWCNRGIALSELGRDEEALESYDRAIKINPAHYKSWFNKGKILFKLNRWADGFASLAKGLTVEKKEEHSYLGDFEAMVAIIFEAKQERGTWQERVKTLVDLYDKHQVVGAIAKGITENIPKLLSEMVSDKAARTWLEVWQEVAAGDKLELEIALRWLKTAVEYKETDGDSKMLLQLPKEERDLFVTLLDDEEK